ncbi:hypothetical protein DL96DRAFT_1705133 [Flagelloscypha sp. PMI_526]|nr:hypothetical protein DL96DRAFT_1705133 [Flagelloscypha sp. PMI_526]
MTRAAKITLGTAVTLAALTVWGVHFQQQQERATMYAGVLRDDARRKQKQQQRLENLEESRRKRELYESVQSVPSETQSTE